MILRLPRGRELLLSYEMNAHPARTWAELRAALRRWTLPVRERVAPGEPFGIAPHIGEGLIGELAGARRRREWKATLDEAGVFPFTVNAFPLKDFHAKRVKERVYQPSWARRRRAELTCKIADLLAESLPEGRSGTISTLGGGYRGAGNSPAVKQRMAASYLHVVEHLARLERGAGILIELAAEPEPDTTLETAADVVAFMEGFLLPAGREQLQKALRISRARAEECLRRHFTVNIDVCHQAVLFRDPVEEWRALEAAGIRVAKLHLTNALALPNPRRSPAALAELLGHDEPRYLHQCAGRRPDGTLWRGRDLGALRRAPLAELEELRVHFHVPLSRARIGRLHTTRTATARALAHALRHPRPPHLVIETYTWPILASRRGPEALTAGIVREFRWVLGEIADC
ncbi:MAG: metabolite traffic protein EboE [Planctomycetota bacterium]